MLMNFQFLGIGSESRGPDIWENLALSSIGGLISSTILLLLVLPPLYYIVIRIKWILMRFGIWMKKVLKKLFRKRGKTPVPAEA